jgi:hypothetical protein
LRYHWADAQKANYCGIREIEQWRRSQQISRLSHVMYLNLKGRLLNLNRRILSVGWHRSCQVRVFAAVIGCWFRVKLTIQNSQLLCNVMVYWLDSLKSLGAFCSGESPMESNSVEISPSGFVGRANSQCALHQNASWHGVGMRPWPLVFNFRRLQDKFCAHDDISRAETKERKGKRYDIGP